VLLVGPGPLSLNIMAGSPAAEALATLANLVNGCRDDNDGIVAKKSLVESFVAAANQNLLDVMCSLHVNVAIAIDGRLMIKAVTWTPVPARPQSDATAQAGGEGIFLSTALSAVGEGGETARIVVEDYVAANPKVDVVNLIRYLNERGHIQIADDVLVSTEAVSWRKPPPKKKAAPEWCKRWSGRLTPTGPQGAPTFVKLRDNTGRKANLAFLGSVDLEGGSPTLATPEDVLVDVWNMPRPTMLVNGDAGSMHPRMTDECNLLHNLPMFTEWLEQANVVVPEDDGGTEMEKITARLSQAAPSLAKATGSAPGDLEAGIGAGAVDGPATKVGWAKLKKAGGGLNLKTKSFITMQELMRMTIDDWQTSLKAVDTDALMNESSINTLIFTKLTEVFSALLDAVKLNDSWVLVDRTAGQGSATAEVLLENALQRGAVRPTIVAVDSLERLGNAREGCNSLRIMKQLSDLYDDENATQAPNGTEKDLNIDFIYDVKEFDRVEPFRNIRDSELPFPVLAEHQRPKYNNTCDPNRKWRYFYMDGLFANASHYIIKNNDKDDFNLDLFAPMGYLYAHGDSRTYKRLANNIQQGRSIVMLHNSGGCTTAFSWLQRVYAHQRPAPDLNRLRAPLKFLIANLSKANWSSEFGVSEMIMMKNLAERAPHLFRKHVVSVDIMSNSMEEVLETITGCFSSAAAGGVPELGLGNAESNVIYNAWGLHTTLCSNAKMFNRLSKIAQTIIWLLAVVTTTLAVVLSSLSGGAMKGAITDPEKKAKVMEGLENAVLLLPIATALVTTILSKLLWRDKWSVCLMAASQIGAEIYKFRMGTLEYCPSIMVGPPGEDDEDPKPLTAKQKATMARQIFVHRIQEMYGACLTELSQTGALKTLKKKTNSEQLHGARSERENKPTLEQWLKIKKHTEKFFYKASWVLPTMAFQTWLSGLRPYLHGPSLREEVKTVIETLWNENKIQLLGRPLTDQESKLVRQEVARAIGLNKSMLEPQKDEIRKIQREIVAALWKEKQADERLLESKGELPLSTVDAFKGRVAGGSAQVAPVDDEDEEVFTDGKYAMRKQMMELQGAKYGKQDAATIKEEKKNRKKSVLAKDIEDDYLCGPLSVESYVVFRVRPIEEKLERHTMKLAWRLQMFDMLGFVFNSAGTILAAVALTEFVSLTVAIVAVLTSIVEFSKLRDQVVSSNLALRDLQSLLVKWDSLSVVRRRTVSIKAEVVDSTEEALLAVVIAHTTAASETQVSVKRKLAAKGMEGDEEAA